MNPRVKFALLLIAACGIPTGAMAHIGVDNHEHSGFLTGFLHPIGTDHLAAMVSVGLWSALAARRAGPALLWGPLGFASMLLVGALIGLQGIAIPAVEPMIAASLLVTGSGGQPPACAGYRCGAHRRRVCGVSRSGPRLRTGWQPQCLAYTGRDADRHRVVPRRRFDAGLGLALYPVRVPRIAGAAVVFFGSVILLQLA